MEHLKIKSYIVVNVLAANPGRTLHIEKEDGGYTIMTDPRPAGVKKRVIRWRKNSGDSIGEPYAIIGVVEFLDKFEHNTEWLLTDVT